VTRIRSSANWTSPAGICRTVTAVTDRRLNSIFQCLHTTRRGCRRMAISSTISISLDGFIAPDAPLNEEAVAFIVAGNPIRGSATYSYVSLVFLQTAKFAQVFSLTPPFTGFSKSRPRLLRHSICGRHRQSSTDCFGSTRVLSTCCQALVGQCDQPGRDI